MSKRLWLGSKGARPERLRWRHARFCKGVPHHCCLPKALLQLGVDEPSGTECRPPPLEICEGKAGPERLMRSQHDEQALYRFSKSRRDPSALARREIPGSISFSSSAE